MAMAQCRIHAQREQGEKHKENKIGKNCRKCEMQEVAEVDKLDHVETGTPNQDPGRLLARRAPNCSRSILFWAIVSELGE